MSKTFTDGIKTPINGRTCTFTVDTKRGPKTFSYLPWALSLAFADRPAQRVVERDGRMFMPVFGGAVVGVAENLPDGTEQVTWLPVLDGANRPIAADAMTSRDLGDAINRCRAKAIAMVHGVGLSLFYHGLDNTLVFLKSLGVKPDDDLSQVQPHVTTSPEKNGEFIDWSVALAAARITDPNFHWEAVFREAIDTTTGEVDRLPYFRMGTGWGVAVKVRYKGVEHTEYLPIMGFAQVQTRNGPKLLDHQPLTAPDAQDWNRSIMRCLVKAIAIASGYGLSVYAKADSPAQLHAEPLQRPAEKAATESTAAPAANDTHAVVADESQGAVAEDTAKAQLVAAVSAALAEANRPVTGLLAWLGHRNCADLSVASVEELERGLKALHPVHRATLVTNQNAVPTVTPAVPHPAPGADAAPVANQPPAVRRARSKPNPQRAFVGFL